MKLKEYKEGDFKFTIARMPKENSSFCKTFLWEFGAKILQQEQLATKISSETVSGN